MSGESAVIRAEGNENKGVYLHWHGDKGSVEAFLRYCELRGFAPFEDDYGMARFTQVVANYVGGNGLTIGIIDNPDYPGFYGIYDVKGWDIVGREGYDEDEDEESEKSMDEMLWDIDQAQPVNQQLGGFLKADLRAVSDIQIGDIVYYKSLSGNITSSEVVGIGKDEPVDGGNMKGVPFMNIYKDDNGGYAENQYNYVVKYAVDTVRVKPRKEEGECRV